MRVHLDLLLLVMLGASAPLMADLSRPSNDGDHNTGTRHDFADAPAQLDRVWWSQTLSTGDKVRRGWIRLGDGSEMNSIFGVGGSHLSNTTATPIFNNDLPSGGDSNNSGFGSNGSGGSDSDNGSQDQEWLDQPNFETAIGQFPDDQGDDTTHMPTPGAALLGLLGLAMIGRRRSGMPN